VQRLVLVDEGKNSRDEFIAFKVRKLPQLARASGMRSIECVASGAPQGAFFCYLD
jgi:hypothetical protein